MQCPSPSFVLLFATQVLIAHLPSDAIQQGLKAEQQGPTTSTQPVDGEGRVQQGAGEAAKQLIGTMQSDGACSQANEHGDKGLQARASGIQEAGGVDVGAAGAGHEARTLSRESESEDGTAEMEEEEGGEEAGGSGQKPMSFDCHPILANAAVQGDEFGWHQDADPQTFPLRSAWGRQYGQYTNRVGAGDLLYTGWLAALV